MPEWLVQLVGAERDLRFLATSLCNPDCRITEDDGEFHLRSRRFEALAGAIGVKAAADEIVDQANIAALVRFEGYRGVLAGTVVGLRPDGSRDVAVFTMAGAVIAGSAMVAGSGTVDLTRDIAHLKRKPLLLKAIRYVRDEPGWSGYWKAVEALGEQVGGVDQIAKLGWASEEEVDRFRETAHHHRHHRKLKPPNPMSETEGRSFVLRLVRRGLDWSRGRSAIAGL